MKRSAVLYIVSLAIAMLAIAIGFHNSRADLIAPGILGTVLMIIAICESLRSKDIKPWICGTVSLTLVICMLSVLFTDLTEWAQYLMATPAYVAIAFNIMMYLVAYCGVRLDRLMACVYLLFTTMAVSNASALVYYYYALTNGVLDEYTANYWINAEFATALILSIVSIIALSEAMKRKGIKLLTSKKLLEGGE